MKTTPLVLKAFTLSACVAMMSISAQAGEYQRTASRNIDQAAAIPGERVVLVKTTASLIPQRVVLMGQNVNTASPLYVVQSHELLRGGSATIDGLLKLEPNLSFRRVR